MKKILFIFCLLTLNSYSQGNYPLHPSVGDTISLVEKLDYALFPETSNLHLAYLTIEFEENRYYLKCYDSTNAITSIDTVAIEEIVEAQKNIEKINAYYHIKTQDNSTSKSVMLKKGVSPKPSSLIFNEKQRKKTQKEARMEMRIREAKKRTHEYQKGYRPNSIEINFK